jgi:hypothetical protein
MIAAGRSVNSSSQFTSSDKTYQIGWVGSRASLDAVVRMSVCASNQTPDVQRIA